MVSDCAICCPAIEFSVYASLGLLEEARLLVVLARVICVGRVTHLLAVHHHIYPWVLVLGVPADAHVA